MEDPFDRSTVTPQYWYNCSSDLRGSAAALLAASEPELSAVVARKFGLGADFSIGIASGAVYEMLCGMSIELMLKAIAVAQRKGVKTHHRLIELAHHVDVSLTPDEEALLSVLTTSIRWAGRYPAPKDRKEWEDTKKIRSMALWEPVDASCDFKTYNGALDWNNVDALWVKLSEVYGAHHLTFQKIEAMQERREAEAQQVERANADYEPPSYDYDPPYYDPY
jgi:hypothetical protein